MLTPEGAAAYQASIAPVLEGGTIVVSDGTESAAAPIESVAQGSDATTLVLTCSFGGDVANFEWKSRSVLLKGGTVIDTEDQDLGRKASPSVWGLTVTLELKGA